MLCVSPLSPSRPLLLGGGRLALFGPTLLCTACACRKPFVSLATRPRSCRATVRPCRAISLFNPTCLAMERAMECAIRGSAMCDCFSCCILPVWGGGESHACTRTPHADARSTNHKAVVVFPCGRHRERGATAGVKRPKDLPKVRQPLSEFVDTKTSRTKHGSLRPDPHPISAVPKSTQEEVVHRVVVAGLADSPPDIPPDPRIRPGWRMMA